MISNYRINAWQRALGACSSSFKGRPFKYLNTLIMYDVFVRDARAVVDPGGLSKVTKRQCSTGVSDIREILFIPEVARDNTAGSCYRLAKAVGYKHSSVLAMCPLDGFDAEADGVAKVYEGAYVISDQVLGFCSGLAIVGSGRLQIAGFFRLFINALQYGRRYSRARRILRGSKCKVVVSPNERLPCSAAWLAAATSLNLKTVCFLHGVPNRLYAPVFSDELWGWGERTIGLFDSPDGVYPMGSLEFSESDVVSEKLEARSGRRRLLFLSQIHGDNLWGTSCYTSIFETLAAGMQKLKERWEVCVRLHPNDSESDREFIAKTFEAAGLDYSFSNKASLDDDVDASDLVLTLSSTAILQSLIKRKPCWLYWDSELYEVFGDPFLPDSFVIKSGELSRFFELGAASGEFEEAIESVLGDYDSASDRGAQRLLELIGGEKV